ncbi:MAG: hypothetical protein GC160_16350 [Acidobacteria bacterium]|nr:hypothetical protein [Acidobacteriota bacterium]
MQLLDAAIAFSLTMLAFSTVVSVALEVGRHFAGVRKKELRRFLGEYYRRELQPSFSAAVQRIEGAAAARVAQQVDSWTESLLQTLTKDGALRTDSLPPPANDRSPAAEVDAFDLIDVSTQEMVDRLRQSELGKQIARELKGEADAVFDYVAQRYERFGEVFSSSFRKSSRQWTVGLSLALAFIANVDSIHLLQAYMLDESTRTAVLSQADAIVAQSKAALDKANADPAAASADGATVEEVRDSLTRLTDRFNSLETNPFPIGWTQFPACPEKAADPRCAAGNPWAPLTWFFGCLLTACLAGLGAPFWYDAVSGLMAVAKRTRGDGGPSAGATAEEPPKPPVFHIQTEPAPIVLTEPGEPAASKPSTEVAAKPAGHS